MSTFFKELETQKPGNIVTSSAGWLSDPVTYFNKRHKTQYSMNDYKFALDACNMQIKTVTSEFGYHTVYVTRVSGVGEWHSSAPTVACAVFRALCHATE
jgi:hypothetical protein